MKSLISTSHIQTTSFQVYRQPPFHIFAYILDMEELCDRHTRPDDQLPGLSYSLTGGTDVFHSLAPNSRH